MRHNTSQPTKDIHKTDHAHSKAKQSITYRDANEFNTSREPIQDG